MPFRRLPTLAATLATALLAAGSAGCKTQTTEGGAAATSAASAPAATAPTSAAASSPAVCAPWAPAPRSVTTYRQAGRGDFFRKFRYTFATSQLQLHDSDPFASGEEADQPRVLKQQRTLSAADKARVEQALLAICQAAGDSERACAPGGCSRMEVAHTDGSVTKLEEVEAIGAIVALFEPFFKELRTK